MSSLLAENWIKVFSGLSGSARAIFSELEAECGEDRITLVFPKCLIQAINP